GVQVRRDGGDPGVSGVDCEIEAVHRARFAQGDARSGGRGTNMSCSEFDWKAYLLEEIPRGDAASYREHAASCEDCAAELAGVQLTRDALLTLREEEVPRRIAFVSDKVFEPTWWQRLFASGPRTGFAAAAMLSAAIVVHGFAAKPTTLAAPNAPV